MMPEKQHEQALLINMQYLLMIASGLVFTIGMPLFLLPAHTDTLFAWTINPPMTAAFLGAAYLSSFFLEFLASRESSWPRSRVAVPAVLAFTILTLIATLIHFDKFHFGTSFAWYTRLGTFVWLVVYATVPFLMSYFWWRQMQGNGHLRPNPPLMRADQTLPRWFQVALTAQAAFLIPLGVGLFIQPLRFAPLWPWALTALTGRAIGAWVIGIGVTSGHMAWENDWQRIYAGCVSSTVLGVLQLLALWRFAQAVHPITGVLVFDWSQLQAWFYLIFLIIFTMTGGYGWWHSHQKQAI